MDDDDPASMRCTDTPIEHHLIDEIQQRVLDGIFRNAWICLVAVKLLYTSNAISSPAHLNAFILVPATFTQPQKSPSLK